jgi:uncharacterized membrane protein YdjX (TVP38/TMEM64 family)
MTFGDLNRAMGATFVNLIGCAIVSIIGLVVGAVIGILPALMVGEGEPLLFCAAVGWIIAMGLFVHQLDKQRIERAAAGPAAEA